MKFIPIEKLSKNYGSFGQHTVHGSKYRSPDGKEGWHITATNKNGDVHDYWSVNGELHEIDVHYNHPETNGHLFNIGRKVDVDYNEACAIREAIERWDREIQNPSTARADQ